MEATHEEWNIEDTCRIPLLGEVAAGAPLEVFSVEETLDVPESLWKGKKVFALRARGRSMIDAGIRDGDYLIVEPCETADNGRTVVAEIDGRVTVKKLYRECDGQLRLQPANPEMLPLRVPGNEVRIRGVVVGVLRKYGFRASPPAPAASPPRGGEAEHPTRFGPAGLSAEERTLAGGSREANTSDRVRSPGKHGDGSDGSTLELALNVIDAQIDHFRDLLQSDAHLTPRERLKLATLGRDLQALREWCGRTSKASLRRALIADAAKLMGRMQRLTGAKMVPPDVTLH